MAQLNLYVPDELAAQLKREAAAQGKSLSRLVVEDYLTAAPRPAAFGPAFWGKLEALGPLPEDFTAPTR